jgi:hypothetical protein
MGRIVMERNKSGLFIVCFSILFLASCTNYLVIYDPDVFETGNTMARQQFSVGASFGAELNQAPNGQIVSFLPDYSFNLGYGIIDRLTVRARASGGTTFGGSINRYGASVIFKYLDIGYLRSSLSGGAGYLGSRTETSNLNVKVKTGYDSFYARAGLNLGIYPFKKTFCLYGNFGMDEVAGSVLETPQNKKFAFDRLTLLAGGGLGFEFEGVDIKIGCSFPLNIPVMGVGLPNNYILNYLPNAAMEFNLKFGGIKDEKKKKNTDAGS